MFAGELLHAEPVTATSLEQSPFAAVSPQAENLESSVPIANTTPATEQLSEHPSYQSQLGANRSLNSAGAMTSTHDNASWQREFSSVIKEAVRPTYQDIADSGFVEAIRSIESEIGLRNTRPFGSESGPITGNSGSEPHRESADWATSGNNPGPTGRVRSADEIERDQLMAKVMLKELVEEVKPWVFTLIGLYALGYSVKLLLDYRRWKMARRRRRTSAGKHRTRGGRHSTSPMPASDPMTDRALPPQS